MGSIPEYQRKQLASTYVGAAQKDDSGALATQAVRESIEPTLRSSLGRLKEREDLLIEQQVNNKLIGYSLDIEKEARELRKFHSDTPEQYPEKLLEVAKKKADALAKDIPNARVRDGFLAASTTIQKQMPANAVAWSFQKQEENALIAVDDSVRQIELISGEQTDPESLRLNLSSLYSTVHTLPGALIDSKVKNEKFKDGAANAFAAYAANMIQENPYKFGLELERGVYDGFMIPTDDGGSVLLPITATEKQKYLTAAKNAEATAEARKNLNKTFEDAGSLNVLAEKYSKGEVGIKEVLATERAIANDPKSSLEAKEYISALRKSAMSKKAASAVDDVTVLDSINSKWAALETRLDKGVKPERIITDLLKLQTEIEEASAEGWITPASKSLITRKLTPHVYAGAAKQTGFSILGIGADPLHSQYGQIVKRVQGMKLNKTQEMSAKATTFRNFVEQVVASEAKGMSAFISADYAKMIDKAFLMTQAELNPGAQEYQIGVEVPTSYGAFKCIGYDEMGSPLLDLPKELEDKLRAMK
jgi:hypothetical protein